MFKARVLVSQGTDEVGETASLERLARSHQLDEPSIAEMTRAVSAVIAELKRTDSDMIASGIALEVKKTVATDDYQITLEVQASTGDKSGRRNFLSRLLGR